jgi:serine/threonine protein kinase
MSDRTVREEGPQPTRRESAAAPTRREPVVDATQREPAGVTVRETQLQGEGAVRHWGKLFPNALAARFPAPQRLAGGGEADCYRLTGADGETVFGKVYRVGFPKASVLQQIGKAAPHHVVRLIEYAAPTEEDAGWELLEYVHHGSLHDLVAREGPKLAPQRVRQILEELAGAIAHIHELKIEHRDLKPANVLIRGLDPLDLVLTDFGISSEIAQTSHFTRADRTDLYAPPEGFAGQVVAQAWDYWSLGMMLVELLTGRHPLCPSGKDADEGLGRQRIHAELTSRNPDDFVAGVEGEAWIKLCRGLLRRAPEHRWRAGEIARWLKNPSDPALVVHKEHARTGAKPFRFQGTDYDNLGELTARLIEDRALLESLWFRDERGARTRLLEWVADDLGDMALHRALQNLDRANCSRETTLMCLLHWLDPARPLLFAGQVLDSASLVAAADRAGAGDRSARDFLIRLHEEDVLRSAASLTGHQDLKAAVGAWRAAIADFETGAAAAARSSGGALAAPRLDKNALGLLLAAATPNSNAIRQLRQQAAAASPAARACLWYAQLGDPSGASAGSLLVLIAAAPAAAEQVIAAQAARAERNCALWLQVAAGCGIGAGGGALWWVSVASWCDGGERLCQDMGWYRHALATFDILFLAATLVTAGAVLASVHRQTAGRTF